MSDHHFSQADIGNLNEELLKLITANINDIIVIRGLAGNCRYVSPSVQKILGFSPAEVAGTSYFSYYHPDDAARIGRFFASAAAGQPAAVTRFEYRCRRKDGTYCWLEGEVNPISDAAGKTTELLVISRDITDRKQIEAARSVSEMRLRDFARAIPDVSMIVDANGRFVEIFAADETLLSQPGEQLKGHSLYQGRLKKNAGFLVKMIRQTLKTRQPQLCSLELTDKAERQFVELRMAPMNYLADGKKTVAIVFTSVTEKRRAEKLLEFTMALRQRSNFMDEMIGGLRVDSTAVAEAKALGIDLTAPLFCCAVRLAGDGGGGDNADSFNRRQNLIIEHLCKELRLLVWDCHGDIGVLVNAGACGDHADDTRIAEHILAAVKDCAPRMAATIGVGNRHAGLEGIGKSWRQAASAVRAAISQGRQNLVSHYCDIGVYKFLTKFCGEEEAKEYIGETLRSLIEHDRRRGTDLLHALEVILRSASLKEAAQSLFLHYNTMIRQKHRIEKILGVNIEDVETRLALAAAVKLHRLVTGGAGKR